MLLFPSVALVWSVVVSQIAISFVLHILQVYTGVDGTGEDLLGQRELPCRRKDLQEIGGVLQRT